jgi:hypothetical protein
VLTVEVAVVGGEEDHRVVQLTSLLELANDPSHALVDGEQCR